MMRAPRILEINARSWLRGLTERHHREVNLAQVPEEEFLRWEELGMSHLWLMGVWPTGPRSRRSALNNPSLAPVFDVALPGWTADDVGGSPYAIAAYEVAGVIGGRAGLEVFRRRLHAHGIKLILDFIPNHLGLDHGWVQEHPDYFMAAAARAKGAIRLPTSSGPRWFAHGRDPHFPPWADTVQVDIRQPGARAALIDTLKFLASLCDGVRCDMAMLLLNEVFAATWATFRGPVVAPGPEFWAEAIEEVKSAREGFEFIGEVYWDLEARLQSLGFDFTYDKRLYDYLVDPDPAAVQRHLLSLTPEFLARSVHFLENHDEPRIASVLSLPEQRAATLLILGLPGLTLLHEGQCEGALIKAPVHLHRRFEEPVDAARSVLHHSLLGVARQAGIGQGGGRVLRPAPAWAGNPTWTSFVVVLWQPRSERMELVVVNLAAHRAQCFVPLGVPGLERRNWRLADRLSSESHERRGEDLLWPGLYLDVPAHAAQVFSLEPVL